MIFLQDEGKECGRDICTYINDYELENSDRIKLVKMKGKEKEGIQWKYKECPNQWLRGWFKKLNDIRLPWTVQSSQLVVTNETAP